MSPWTHGYPHTSGLPSPAARTRAGTCSGAPRGGSWLGGQGQATTSPPWHSCRGSAPLKPRVLSDFSYSGHSRKPGNTEVARDEDVRWCLMWP